MKTISLSSEWIQGKLSCGWIADGKGNVCLQVDAIGNAGFMEFGMPVEQFLSLGNLGIGNDSTLEEFPVFSGNSTV